VRHDQLLTGTHVPLPQVASLPPTAAVATSRHLDPLSRIGFVGLAVSLLETVAGRHHTASTHGKEQQNTTSSSRSGS